MKKVNYTIQNDMSKAEEEKANDGVTIVTGALLKEEPKGDNTKVKNAKAIKKAVRKKEVNKKTYAGGVD